MGPPLKGFLRGRLNSMLVTAPENIVTLLRATVCSNAGAAAGSSKCGRCQAAACVATLSVRGRA